VTISCYRQTDRSSAAAYDMDRDSELAIVRRAYAKQVTAATGVADRRVEAAFAVVPREAFLGPGPWPILSWGGGYVKSPTRNPIYLYADVLVGIVPERNLNNGQPSFLALLIAAPAPRPGEHAVPCRGRRRLLHGDPGASRRPPRPGNRD
jgi:hypothetical protein